MHKTTKNLQSFYDSTATTFSGTRKRDWPEFDYILSIIENYIKENNLPTDRPLRILELGCGDGRLCGFLEQYLDNTLEYVGVDISLGLLTIANKNFPKQRRIHNDMTSHLLQESPDQYDFVIGIASFHHLPTVQLRVTTLDGIYRTLIYNGKLIMTNRCYSDRFKGKFAKEIQSAKLKAICSLGYFDKDDIMVPRKDQTGKLIAKRLYHIFSQDELERLCTQTGFTRIEQVYITTSGELSDNERQGRNLVTIGVKSIWE